MSDVNFIHLFWKIGTFLMKNAKLHYANKIKVWGQDSVRTSQLPFGYNNYHEKWRFSLHRLIFEKLILNLICILLFCIFLRKTRVIFLEDGWNSYLIHFLLEDIVSNAYFLDDRHELTGKFKVWSSRCRVSGKEHICIYIYMQNPALTFIFNAAWTSTKTCRE